MSQVLLRLQLVLIYCGALSAPQVPWQSMEFEAMFDLCLSAVYAGQLETLQSLRVKTLPVHGLHGPAKQQQTVDTCKSCSG